MRAPEVGDGPRIDVLAFGEALVDFFPSRPGIPLAECETFHRHLGGAPCNVAVALARAGRRPGLMTLLGRDDFGRFVRTRLEAEGVDVRGVGTHPTARTGITFVAVKGSGERSFLFYRHPSADQLVSEADVDPAVAADARIFHLGSSTLAREPARAATWRALAAARDAGRVISCDPNLRPHLWERPEEARRELERLLPLCDLVKVSDEELEPIVGTADLKEGGRRLLATGASVVIITRGAAGARVVARAGDADVPVDPVTVVDTTGAGDAFVGGMLAALVPTLGTGRRPRELSLEELVEACRAGNALGRLAVTALGATAAVPRRAAGIPPVMG